MSLQLVWFVALPIPLLRRRRRFEVHVQHGELGRSDLGTETEIGHRRRETDRCETSETHLIGFISCKQTKSVI